MSSLKVPVNKDDHIQGNLDAPITLVEYGDYECLYCGVAYRVIKQLQEALGSNLRFVFRNFPLREMHPYAELAAETAEFAGDAGQYWEVHDLLYENQDRLSREFMFELTTSLGLATQSLENALVKRSYEPKIRTDFIGGVRSGVNGTPTLFINEERYNGPPDYESLVRAMQEFL